MKVYFEASLEDVARTIGYTEELLISIGSCSKLKRAYISPKGLENTLLGVTGKLYE